jgi:3-deoxy-D-manno-octulosonic-acid transferase
MLEPAALSKPIIFGPNVFNFAEISSNLLNKKAGIQVQDSKQLFTEIMQLLNNPEQLESLGANAKQYFDSQQGAVKRIAKIAMDII